MPTLVLQVRPGDLMIVNGAMMRFRTKARIDLPAPARFLLGKQIMSRAQAYSPARHIYLALQAAYVGPEEDREAAQHATRRLIAKFQATASGTVRHLLDQALFAAEFDDHFRALKLVRLIILHEDADLTRTEIPLPMVPLKGGLYFGGSSDWRAASGGPDIGRCPCETGGRGSRLAIHAEGTHSPRRASTRPYVLGCTNRHQRRHSAALVLPIPVATVGISAEAGPLPKSDQHIESAYESSRLPGSRSTPRPERNSYQSINALSTIGGGTHFGNDLHRGTGSRQNCRRPPHGGVTAEPQRGYRVNSHSPPAPLTDDAP